MRLKRATLWCDRVSSPKTSRCFSRSCPTVMRRSFSISAASTRRLLSPYLNVVNLQTHEGSGWPNFQVLSPLTARLEGAEAAEQTDAFAGSAGSQPPGRKRSVSGGSMVNHRARAFRSSGRGAHRSSGAGGCGTQQPDPQRGSLCFLHPQRSPPCGRAAVWLNSEPA